MHANERLALLAVVLSAAVGCRELAGIMDHYELDAGAAGDATSTEQPPAAGDDEGASSPEAATTPTTPKPEGGLPPVVDASGGDAFDATVALDTGADSSDSPSVLDTGADSPESPSALDAAGDALDASSTDAGPAVAWRPFADPASWQTMDLSSISRSADIGFIGGAFDGRYIYFAPWSTGVLMRYDTSLSFASSPAWAMFDLTTVDSRAGGFEGAVFDGRFVYLIPNSTTGSLTMQCDTTSSGGCLSAGSWTVFSLAAVDDAGTEYAGGVYDGRYIDYIPNVGPAGAGLGVVLARYDTLSDGGLASSGSWSTVATNTLAAGLSDFFGAVYDGRRTYFVPNAFGPLAINDPTQPLAASAAWNSIDLSSVSDAASSGTWATGAFDGRYVYLAPFAAHGAAMRCDTQGAGCAAKTAWTPFSMDALDDAGVGGMVGTAFDGRYVYFAPRTGSIAVRVDTTAAFDDTASWSSFDLTLLGAAASPGYWGAVFDGEFVYFVPFGNSLAVRFDARLPPAPPGSPTWGSTF